MPKKESGTQPVMVKQENSKVDSSLSKTESDSDSERDWEHYDFSVYDGKLLYDNQLVNQITKDCRSQP